MVTIDKMNQEYNFRGYSRMNENLEVKCSWCDTPIDWRNKGTVVVTYRGEQFKFCSLDHGAWGLGRMDTNERIERERAETH